MSYVELMVIWKPAYSLPHCLQKRLPNLAGTGIRFDQVDAGLVTRPLHWKPADGGGFMPFFGPISSLIDIFIAAAMGWVFDPHSVARQTRCQSKRLVVGRLTRCSRRRGCARASCRSRIASRGVVDGNEVTPERCALTNRRREFLHRQF